MKQLVKLLVPAFILLFIGLRVIGCTSEDSPAKTPEEKPEITEFYFTIDGTNSSGIIDQTKLTIDVTVPYGTTLNPLVAHYKTNSDSISVNGAIQTSGSTALDFSSSVVYHCSLDGRTQDYTVNVTVAENDECSINSFSISGHVARIDEAAKTILLYLPAGTSKTKLVASFSTSGKTVSVNGTAQSSSLTENDFSGSVKYRVLAENGTSSAEYTVTVELCASGFNDCDNDAANACETDLNTVNNCGSCGKVCATPQNAPAMCTGGVCGRGSCNTGYGDCNGNLVDGCETDLTSSLKSCGKCNVPCMAGQTCVNSKCTP